MNFESFNEEEPEFVGGIRFSPVDDTEAEFPEFLGERDENGVLWVGPMGMIMKMLRHYHIPRNWTPEDIAKTMEEIFRQIEEDREWDSPNEFWMIDPGYPSQYHDAHPGSCDQSSDPDLLSFDPLRLMVAIGHPTEFLETVPAAPAGAFVFLLAESWGLDPDAIERAPEGWTGRAADHPEGVEARMLTCLTPEGHVITLYHQRGEDKYSTSISTLNEVDGEIATGFKTVMKNNFGAPDKWSDKLKTALTLRHGTTNGI